MVSLDDAVLARFEYGGKRFEILIDPTLVDTFRNNPESVELDDFLATEEIWLDARAGERPTSEQLENAFGGVLRHFSLGGTDLHEDGDKREVSILSDDERPFVQYGNIPLKTDKKND